MFEMRPYRRNSMSTWNPFSEMEEMERRLFNNDFFSGRGLAEFKTDITDEGDYYELKADLPGFKKEDIQLQLDGDTRTVTIKRTPETIAWDADYGIRLEQDRTYPILGTYNEYIDVCIGELSASFHPVVYLLTKDGVVEYVDVLRCLMFGNALVCQDPIYIANNGVALERSGSEVNLRRADGSVLELAPLTAEWNGQEIPSEAVGAFNDMGDNQFDWMDVESNGIVQMGVQDNNVFYQGFADYLGVVPEGMVLGISASETEDGMQGITFVVAVKYDLFNETLNLTMIDGENPFKEGATQLQMIRCPDY